MKKASVVVLALAASACTKKADSGGAGAGSARKLQYPVDVASLVMRKLQYSVDAPGSIDAFQTVQISARVSGAVDRVNFLEGQEVKAGAVLATIESERYAIAVDQAKATLAKANATQHAAEQALQRRLEAQKQSPGIVAGEEIETKQAALDSAKADVMAAKEALHVAQLNLRDSAVRSPIPGVVQTRTVNQGQVLQTGAVLATIIQRDPMLVRFQVTEQDAPRLQKDMVLTLSLKEAKRTYTAKISLVGGAADPTTRLVPITAQVDSTDTSQHGYWLRPGAFCQVSVPVDAPRDGIVVPSLAVQPTEKGNVVYVLDDKQKGVVHAMRVELGMHTADGGVEITRGFLPPTADKSLDKMEGLVIVVNGIDPLTDGAPVKVGATMTLEQAQDAQKKKAGTESGSGSGSGSEPASGSGSGSGSEPKSEVRSPKSGSGHHRGSAQ
jgi:RND family efflux transporter MFP subunit